MKKEDNYIRNKNGKNSNRQKKNENEIELKKGDCDEEFVNIE